MMQKIGTIFACWEEEALLIWNAPRTFRSSLAGRESETALVFADGGEREREKGSRGERKRTRSEKERERERERKKKKTSSGSGRFQGKKCARVCVREREWNRERERERNANYWALTNFRVLAHLSHRESASKFEPCVSLCAFLAPAWLPKRLKRRIKGGKTTENGCVYFDHKSHISRCCFFLTASKELFI